MNMQAAVQSRGHSVRPLTGSASPHQLKCRGDIAQNNYVPARKRRKRERTDQNADPGKHERPSKSDDNDVNPIIQERNKKCHDISNFLGKSGGLKSLVGVDRLISLMQYDKTDSVQNLSDVVAQRTALVSVIAATDRDDCLNRFVQLAGLPLLDGWLQEAQKSKDGENGSPREVDRVQTGLLLMLLRALERLPIDLVALRTCIVGKSVNNLRNHKNLEIQKQARKLVDVWKKRVDAEMNHFGESNLGSTQGMPYRGKQCTSDQVNSSMPKSGHTSEVHLKSSGILGSSFKNVPTGLCSTDFAPKNDLVHLGTGKATSAAPSTAALNIKEYQNKDSSSISSGLLCSNFGQKIATGSVWPSGHVKGVNSNWREDGQAFSSFSMLHGQPSIPAAHSDYISGKNINGSNQTANFKDFGPGKPLLWSRSVSQEKPGNTETGLDRGANGDIMDNSNNNRLVVKISNPVNAATSSDKAAAEGNFMDSSNNHRLIVRIPIPGNTATTSSDKGVTEQSFMDSSINHRLTFRIPIAGRSLAHSFSGEPCPDYLAPSSRSSSPSILDSRAKDFTDVRSGMQIPVSSQEGVADSKGKAETGKENSSGLSNIVDPRDCEKKQKGCYNSLKSDNSNQSDAQMECSSIAAVNVHSWPNCTADPGDVKQLESPSNAHGESVFTRSCAFDLDPETVSSGLTNMATSESTANEQNVMCAASEMSSTLEAVNTGQGLDKKPFVSSAFLQRSYKLDTGGTWATNGCQEALYLPKLLPMEMDVKCDPESGEEGHGNATCNGFASECCPPREGEIKDDCVSISPKVSTDHPLTKDHCSASIMAECTCSEVDVLDEEKRETVIGEVGQDLARAKEMVSQNVSESVLLFPAEDALEVARQVAREIEQEMESYQNISSEEEIFNTISVHGNKDVKITEMGETVAAMEMSEGQLRGKDSASQTLPGTTQLGKICLNLSKLDEKMPETLAAKEVNQALGKSENEKMDPKAVDCGFIDEEERANTADSHLPSLSCHPTNFDMVPLQGSLNPVPRNSETGRCNGTERIIKSALENTTCEGGYTRRCDFDLNEGFSEEVHMQDNVSTMAHINPLSGIASTLAVPIAVVVATKGPFILPSSPLQTKRGFGWKGSAATSAFRPAEPRRTLESQSLLSESVLLDRSPRPNVKQSRLPLDFDLNVPDKRVFEDVDTTITTTTTTTQGLPIGGDVMLHSFMSSSHTFCPAFSCDTNTSGKSKNYSSMLETPILDLNYADKTQDWASILASSKVIEWTGFQNCSSKASSVGGKSTAMDFDLNAGLSVDDIDELRPLENATFAENIGLPSVLGFRIGREAADVSQWPQGRNSFSALEIPAFTSVNLAPPPFPVAGAQSLLSAVPSSCSSFLGAQPSSSSFHSDIYQTGMAFPSSAVAYPEPVANMLPYAGFPFGLDATSLSAVSAPFMDSSVPSSFATWPAQILGPSAVMPQFVRSPYLAGGTGGTNSSCDSVWPRPKFDLNAGPDPVEADPKDDTTITMQSSFFGGFKDSNAVFCPAIDAGQSLKRKGPNLSWSMHRPVPKQQAWQ